jgi:hypothetical protein
LRGLQALPLFKQGSQPLIAFSKFNTHRSLCIVFRQSCGSLPPPLGSVAIDSRITIVGHRAGTLPNYEFDLVRPLRQQCPLRQSRVEGGMDSDELLDRAAHYRDLAIHTLDEQTKQGLLELAEKYEPLARDAAKREGSLLADHD